MININGKEFETLNFKDVEEFLQEFSNEENFFIELKNDDISNKDFMKEFSAFSNTYGGYIFLGVENNKDITGCQKWTENRIHTLVRDSISPVPYFEVKKLINDKNILIYIIKIEEGILPPYITKSGKIYERVSSGSCPIEDSNKLTQLYYKREDNFKKLEDKLSIESIKNPPDNLCAYVDVVFEPRFIEKRDYIVDFKKISEILSKRKNVYSISEVGDSINITIGNYENSNYKALANMHNFIEIMKDGSMKFRIVLFLQDNGISYILQLIMISLIFEEIYSEIFGKVYSNNFIEARKYQKLTVLKQFTPVLRINDSDEEYAKNIFNNYLTKHKEEFGNNLIFSSNRKPIYGFEYIDKKVLEKKNIQNDIEKIIKELFYTDYGAMGYIKGINID